ncbi:SDR family NAD(P)-dependent oxidoreductase [Dactylosporangium sp. AC04546]|uniref:SDR family NAD(P)-dependent oxidoreductase n=1 Tax=Dactylosporangium sp. AC04546 TaxID=2862460 RepID=UPI001EDC99A3|nr:SDR family NAD(P)-dependent oxidoreductase [Dactylosporangium sp. AC04546]WVK86960.1 SDR family NAD(P)-dependent oxidoreductase [Dactylosporangium sp. AC04546]
MDVDGASAIVTGGAGGLGAATVRQLVSGGASVVIADLADEAGQRLAGELGTSVRFVHTDVTDEVSVQGAVDAASELGPLRIVVTAHGGPVAQSRILDRSNRPYPLETFRRTLDIYLVGTFNTLRLSAARMASCPALDSGQRGVVINTASIAAFEGQVGQSDYSAAKGGVVGLGLVAARDLAPLGIRVMTIAPGTFFTPAFQMSEEDAQAKWGGAIPNPQRMGRPAEYARLVQAIVENDYLNGEVIRIDGAHRFGPR